MARKNTNLNCVGPFHVTLRTINKEWFRLSMDETWEIFERWLYFSKHAFNLEIHSFVLMSNHYHMLVSTPDHNLILALTYFHRELSRDLNRCGGRINRNFSGPYFKCRLQSYHYFLNCYKYVYQNPVRAGLVDRAEDYKFSTLSGKLGKFPLLIPVVNDSLLFEGDLSKNLLWINKEIDPQDLDSMRGALKKSEFLLRKDLLTRKSNRLETAFI